MVHRFPKDEPSCKQWLRIIGRDESWIPSKSSLLCSDHFTEDSFSTYNNRNKKRIKPGALPTILRNRAEFELQSEISIDNKYIGKKKTLQNFTKKYKIY